MNFTTLLKTPSALAPLVMSLTAFLLILVVVSSVGITQQHDEGAPARLFQLLIVLQLPIMVFFAVKWLPRSPRLSLLVMLLQMGAASAAVATIVWLESGMAV